MTTSAASLGQHLVLLRRESSVLIFGTGLSMLAAIVALAILVKTLPATSLGMLIVINTYPLLAHQVINLQSWQGFVRTAQNLVATNNRPEMRELLKFFFVIDLATTALAAGLAFVLAHPIARALAWSPDWVEYLQLFALSLLLNFSSFSLGVLRLFKHYKWQAACALVSPLAQLGATIILAAIGAPITTYLWAWFAIALTGSVIQLAAAQHILRKHGLSDWWRAPLRYFSAPLKFTFWVNVATSLDASVKQLDVLLVSTVVSLEAVPVYRFIKQAGVFLYRFADVFAQTSYSRLVELLADNQLRSALTVMRTVMLWIAPFALAYLFLIMGTASYWLEPLFNAAFAANGPELYAYLAVAAVAVLFTPLHQLIYALGFVRLPAATTALAVATFIFLSFKWGAAYGLMGFVGAIAVYNAIALLVKLVLLVIVSLRGSTARGSSI